MTKVTINDKRSEKIYKFTELVPGKIYKCIGPKKWNGIKNENVGDIVTIIDKNSTLISLKPVKGVFNCYFTPEETGHTPEEYIETYVEFHGTITIQA